MAFTKPYPDGWENGEIGNTPITAEILNDYDDFFEEVSNDIGKFDFSTDPSDNGYIWLYDAEHELWKPVSFPLSIVSTPSPGEVLRCASFASDVIWTNSRLHISDLSNVELNNIQEGDALVFEYEQQGMLQIPVLKNKSVVSSLNSLSDVDAASPSVGQVLRRGEVLGTAVWTNSWLYASDIKDIILNNPTTGDILVCEMTPDPIIEVPKWKNKPFPVSANPSDTAAATLTKIKINDVVYGISGGGGGGSTVSYTAVVQSGTKLGTITIDGVGYDVYAPTVNVPTKTSDLTNDSNFVADASYVHTDNNYSTNDKNKVADLVQVVANPSSGTSAGNLTSISVGGTKYDIPSGGGGSSTFSGLSDVAISNVQNGQVPKWNSTTSKWENANESGGGTTVVANPSGTATANLTKLQVGNDIYAIPSGGGGSYTDVTGTLTAGQTQITLSVPTLTENSTIDVYTDAFGVSPTYMEILSGQTSLIQGTVTQESQLGITVSASSQWDSNYPAWKAFLPDGSASGWVAGQDDTNIYYQIEFNTPTLLKQITYGGEDPNRQQAISRVQYSSDGTTWSTCTLTSSVYGNCIIANPAFAKYWRLCYDDEYGPSYKPLMEDTHLYTVGYVVQLTFPVQSSNLGVKVRVS